MRVRFSDPDWFYGDDLAVISEIYTVSNGTGETNAWATYADIPDDQYFEFKRLETEYVAALRKIIEIRSDEDDRYNRAQEMIRLQNKTAREKAEYERLKKLYGGSDA